MLSLLLVVFSAHAATDSNDVRQLVGYMVGQEKGAHSRAQKIVLDDQKSTVFRQSVIGVSHADCDYDLQYTPGGFFQDLQVKLIEKEGEFCRSAGALVSDTGLDGIVNFGMLSNIGGQMFFTDLAGVHGVENQSSFQIIFDYAVATALVWYKGQ